MHHKNAFPTFRESNKVKTCIDLIACFLSRCIWCSIARWSAHLRIIIDKPRIKRNKFPARERDDTRSSRNDTAFRFNARRKRKCSTILYLFCNPRKYCAGHLFALHRINRWIRKVYSSDCHWSQAHTPHVIVLLSSYLMLITSTWSSVRVEFTTTSSIETETGTDRRQVLEKETKNNRT